MDIQIEWHNDQFNVHLASKPEAEPFLTVKGCRLASGSKGAFVSWPATKNQQSGKWWSHVWGSERFNAAVLEKVQASQPSQTRGRSQRHDEDGDIPF
jgi:hypothetical protein